MNFVFLESSVQVLNKITFTLKIVNAFLFRDKVKMPTVDQRGACG